VQETSLWTDLSSRLLGYKLVYVGKRDEKCQIICYKVCLVTQRFKQKFGIDYNSTYSPVMDLIIYQYLIGMAVYTILEMHPIDVVTAYLYGSLHANIYMKVPPDYYGHFITHLW